MKSRVIDERRTKEIVRSLMMSFAQVLFDKHGFTHDEVVTILKEIDYTWDSVRTGRLEIGDLEKILDEEYDIQFE